jgi:Ca2+-binding RTX toxin-like protein
MPLTDGREYIISRNALGELAEDGEIAALSDGRIVVVYDNTNITGYVQIFDPETGLSTLVQTINGPYGIRDLSVAALDDGGFVVTWNSPTSAFNERVMVQRYDAAGTPQDSPQILAEGNLADINVHQTSTGYFVTWCAQDGPTDVYYGRFFQSSGQPLAPAFQIDGDAFGLAVPDAALLDTGRLALAWRDEDDIAWVQLYNGNGQPLGAAVEIGSIDTPGWFGSGVRVAAGQNGSFTTLYQIGQTLYLQNHTRTGALDGPARPLDTGDLVLNLNWNAPHDLEIFPDGTIAVAFEARGENGDSDVFYAYYAADGTALTPPIVANFTITDDQGQLEFTRMPDGRLFLAFGDDNAVQWQSQQSIRGIFLSGPDTVWLGTERRDTHDGTEGSDTLAARGGNDTLNGLGGNDYIMAGAGNDTADGGAGADNIYGGDGRDTLSGGLGDDRISGDADDDTLLGDEGSDILRGGDGDDRLFGGKGSDTLRGDAGNDRLLGDTGDDAIYGGLGDDRLLGGAGNDSLHGDEGNDTILGGKGIDSINGDAGNDIIKGGADTDNLIGNEGNDRIWGQGGADLLFGSEGRNFLYGGADNDIVTGGIDRDTLVGGSGDDQLRGRSGNDIIRGGTGNDAITGGTGNDRMAGGSGADEFKYYKSTYEPDFGRDTITDFTTGEDKLDFRGMGLEIGTTLFLIDTARGLRLQIDADNSILLVNQTLASFDVNDILLTY